MIDPRIMALMSMSAGLMDPRGTYGSAGAAMNNALQAGMNTYLPMMQWQQAQEDRKEEKDYRKSRDRVMDRFRKDQQSVSALQLEMQSRGLDIQEQAARTSAANADLQRQMVQIQLDIANAKKEMFNNLFAPKTVAEAKETRAEDTGFGPLVSKVPPSQWGPRVQQPQVPQIPQAQFNPMPQQESLQDIMRPVPPQQAPSQFMSMTPMQQMMVGDYLDMPGISKLGENAIDLEQFKKKEDYKASLKDMEEKFDLRVNPFNGNYDVFTRDSKAWVGRYDPATGRLIEFGKVVK